MLQVPTASRSIFRKGLNTWCHSISVTFKRHSISVTFKFFAVRVARCVLEPHSTDSLGTQHHAKFHALIITTPSIQARCCTTCYTYKKSLLFPFALCISSPLSCICLPPQHTPHPADLNNWLLVEDCLLDVTRKVNEGIHLIPPCL